MQICKCNVAKSEAKKERDEERAILFPFCFLFCFFFFLDNARRMQFVAVDVAVAAQQQRTLQVRNECCVKLSLFYLNLLLILFLFDRLLIFGWLFSFRAGNKHLHTFLMGF